LKALRCLLRADPARAPLNRPLFEPDAHAIHCGARSILLLLREQINAPDVVFPVS
jgi:hypothetical protein